MKYAIIFLVSLFITSCGVNKDIRRLQRGSKKLEKLVTKFPELKKDTIIRDTVLQWINIITKPDTTIDTVTVREFILVNDTVYPKLINHSSEGFKLSLNYLSPNKYDLRIIERPDTIRELIEVPVEVEVETIQPAKLIEKKLTGWQKFRIRVGELMMVLVLLFLGYVVIRVINKLKII